MGMADTGPMAAMGNPQQRPTPLQPMGVPGMGAPMHGMRGMHGGPTGGMGVAMPGGMGVAMGGLTQQMGAMAMGPAGIGRGAPMHSGPMGGAWPRPLYES